jgi:hypothetical protein
MGGGDGVGNGTHTRAGYHTAKGLSLIFERQIEDEGKAGGCCHHEKPTAEEGRGEG